ncbi:hypothetical protein [Halalkalicoccus jeotgali]|uniref:Uncharacterized protein n=1 Tax=Halalkalicoccus jeotgali (strain DSM 18796 / CECT 7217 / JCM 14584 / KCTC 4019 / B3) TaxID=795797 RepID=D8J7P6_HALJB|nr:hypothetical protein [Halalkalicoccus jeotgali]ADJ16066.1 hypothetical protein HacjB3_13425 [Halalkalicoccus jeotgali B3]ELY38162.1 hypothetical protein C497_08629 [Halalkalicoccus jeotgali B3]
MQSADSGETRAPFVDLREYLALFLAPTLTVGLAVLALGGRQNLLAGSFLGAMFGAMLVGYRRLFHAVRTDEGIERRLTEVDDSPEGNRWVRLSVALDERYDETYDPILAVVFAVIGLGALAAIPFIEGSPRTLIQLALLGLFGITTSLMTAGFALSR